MNKMRQPKAEPETPVAEKKVKKEKKGEGAARNFIRFVNVFGYFDRKAVMSFMPFLMFLFLLAIVYIGNSYYAEKTIRDIDRTQKEIRELRSEFITARSELMYCSKLSRGGGIDRAERSKRVDRSTTENYGAYQNKETNSTPPHGCRKES